MSALRAILVASPIVAACIAIACKSSDTPRPADLLDCDWAQGTPDNCWKTFVASIDKCLNHPDAGADAPVGVLSADRMSCTYDNGTVVTGTVALDEPREGEDAAAGDAKAVERRSFVVRTASGQVCLAYDQTNEKANLVGPDGSLSWSNDGNELTVTCPDGKTYHGPNSDLLDCLIPGELPGAAWYNTDASAFFQLPGMTGPVYACAAAVDAATDGDAATDAAGD